MNPKKIIKLNSEGKIRVSERPEFRAKNGKLHSIVFRTADKNRRQTRHIGKRSKEFKFYEKEFLLGQYNSKEKRGQNAKRKQN